MEEEKRIKIRDKQITEANQSTHCKEIDISRRRFLTTMGHIAIGSLLIGNAGGDYLSALVVEEKEIRKTKRETQGQSCEKIDTYLEFANFRRKVNDGIEVVSGAVITVFSIFFDSEK